uniref:Putative 7-cyano-7-deazaguanine reductase n=1 Tax=viral metagenome TaxID=1070528 RepID=A0A6M3KLJ4_9ZZZZ
MMDKVDHLKSLGSSTVYQYDEPSFSTLETFLNKYPNREYEIFFDCPEFTSLCPKTGQPDFGKITISYIPDKNCIETKSLKLYLFSYRNYKSFMESIVNKIFEDLVHACDPKSMKVVGNFNMRGGISITISAETEIWI